MAKDIPLAHYLFTRLRQVGVGSIHGVPGDYNLTILDYVEPAGLHWVGSCNELNAGYAADGYSRIKGIGALITTFGVGELSAINAIAGAYAELAPVVHIVGTPTRDQQDSRALIHHTLLDGEYEHFAEMYRHVTVAQANLQDPRMSTHLIDYTLQQCLIHSRPVYIRVPVDMVSAHVSAEGIKERIVIPRNMSQSSAEAAINAIWEHLGTVHQPMILVDGETSAYKINGEANQFVRSTGWPTWVSVAGKQCIQEDLPNYHGIWKGSFANPEHQAYISSADLILCFGPHFSGTNTYAFTAIPDNKVSVLIGATTVSFKGKTYRDLSAKSFMAVLLKKLEASAGSGIPRANVTFTSFAERAVRPPKLSPEGLLTQDRFYLALNKWFRPGDIVLAETGTAGHGCRDFKLPAGARLLKPITWLSIGYMLPASQGAALAQRELYEAGEWPQEQSQQLPRTVLLIGDGSFQMTVQELSTVIREELNVLVILINNDGYTIERCIHGWDKPYNDVPRWRYHVAPALFGAADTSACDKYHAQTSSVKTWQDMEQVFGSINLHADSMLHLVEAVMTREDAPELLAAMLKKQKSPSGL